MTVRPRVRALAAPGLALLTGLVLAGCGSPPDGAGDASPQASDFTGCVVSDEGGFEDHSVNQGSLEGLRAAAADRGIQTAQAQSESTAEYEPNLRSMVQRGCSFTVAAGSRLADATGKAAAANPDRRFAVVDDGSATAENVTPILFDTAEAAFLAGYLAAGTSTSGKVATFGGRDVPAVRASMDGFADGVAHYNGKHRKDVEVLGWNRDSRTGTFLGSFQDSAKASTVTRDLIADGADVVLPVAGQAAKGAVTPVTNANRGEDEVRLIWPDTDGYETLGAGRQFLLTSVLKDVSTAVQDVVTRAVDGTAGGTRYVGTLENGGVGLAPYHDQAAAVGEDLDAQVRQLKQDIEDGRVTVESTATPTP